jgi:tetratricopeptide (TPR) repeat protein
MEKVVAAHDVNNRAETLFNAIKSVHYGRALVDREAWDHEGQALFLTALRWPQESGQARMIRAEKLLNKAEKAGTITPTALFMLGHVQRMRHNLEPAMEFLNRAYEAGEERGALSMGMLNLGLGKLEDSRHWLVKFTGDTTLGYPLKDTLPFEFVRAIARRLVELGEDVSPGFSRLRHDPAVWNALEFYQAAFSSRPYDLETAQELGALLLKHGASAEALDVVQKAMEHHPDDPELGAIYAQAGRASYVTLN